MYTPKPLPIKDDIETKAVLKKAATAHRALAELKGVANSIPRQDILINSLGLQEAKDSSEIENIVTTHDELYKTSIGISKKLNLETKEVKNYVSALKRGYELVKSKQVLTTNLILEIQAVLEQNNAGLRKLPGTNLKNQQTGEVVYEPPQSASEIKELMDNLELFINDDALSDLDPLVKMAVIHFQFESIHPFYDGNGRTGRIINILYLILEGLLDIPILYHSKYIIKNKGDYYRFLQGVRDEDDWESWILFMLEAVEVISFETIKTIHKVKAAMAQFKNQLRDNYKFYSQDLLNHLFKQPYSKIEFLMEELHVSRITAASYLNQLSEDGLLIKQKAGKYNYYVNPHLLEALGVK